MSKAANERFEARISGLVFDRTIIPKIPEILFALAEKHVCSLIVGVGAQIVGKV